MKTESAILLGDLVSLCLSFLIYKMGKLVVYILMFKLVNICKNPEICIWYRIEGESVHSVMSDSLRPHRSWSSRLLWRNSPGKDTRDGLPCPPPGDFPTRVLNPGFLHCRQILYPLSHQGRELVLHKCYLLLFLLILNNYLVIIIQI